MITLAVSKTFNCLWYFCISLQYHTKAIKLTFKIQGLNLPLIPCSSLNSSVLKSDYESRQIKTSFIDLGTFFYATQILCRLVAEIFDGNKFNKKSYIPLKNEVWNHSMSPECSAKYICVGISNLVSRTDKAGVSVSETRFWDAWNHTYKCRWSQWAC